MSIYLARTAALAATAASALALSTGTASATPACTDPAAKALHTVHDTTGDPAGVAHAVEDAYCDAKS